MKKTPLTRACVFEWHQRFSGGREDVEDEQLDCLVMMKTDKNVEKVRTLIRIDHHLGI
jgi:hypothetical protein